MYYKEKRIQLTIKVKDIVQVNPYDTKTRAGEPWARASVAS